MARGEPDRRSDIDVFLAFDTEHDPERGEEFKIAHEIASEVERKHGGTNRFQLVFSNLGLKVDEDFLENLCKEGIIIWGKPLLLDVRRRKLSPKVIISYDLSSLPNYDKLRIHRALYGYRVEREHKGRKYVSKSRGLLADIGGVKLGRGVITIPKESQRYLKQAFDEARAKYRSFEVWGH